VRLHQSEGARNWRLKRPLAAVRRCEPYPKLLGANLAEHRTIDRSA
jgi:hypothetical protein